METARLNQVAAIVIQRKQRHVIARELLAYLGKTGLYTDTLFVSHWSLGWSKAEELSVFCSHDELGPSHAPHVLDIS